MRPVFYQIQQPANGLCGCGFPDCLQSVYGKMYFFFTFDIGTEFEVTYWLSKS